MPITFNELKKKLSGKVSVDKTSIPIPVQEFLKSAGVSSLRQENPKRFTAKVSGSSKETLIKKLKSSGFYEPKKGTFKISPNSSASSEFIKPEFKFSGNTMTIDVIG